MKEHPSHIAPQDTHGSGSLNDKLKSLGIKSGANGHQDLNAFITKKDKDFS